MVLVVLFIVVCGNLVRSGALAETRAVNILQIFVCGALMGMLIANAISSSRAKQD